MSAFTYDSLGKLDTDGIDTASFPEIRDAIAERMRQIYGEDIDLSTASADGQYINMESLIINNIYRLIDNLYKNMNPFSATGKFLDILCSLTNVTRKGASKSVAQIYIKNVSGESQNGILSITLIDRNNTQWQWINPTDLSGNPLVTFEDGEIHILPFSCENYGPTQALGTGANISDPSTDIPWDDADFTKNNGYIYQTIDYGTFKVYQASDAELGSFEESDDSLRSRRYSFLGSNSVTTQASLEAALYAIDGIEDVYILNNVSGSSLTSNDGTLVANHNIYIVLRYKEGVTIDDQLISEIIYNKLTPGVNTNESSEHKGENIHDTITLASGVNTEINWKKCISDDPQIVITFRITDDYVSSTNGKITSQLINYLSKIKLNETLVSSSILTSMSGADPKKNGRTTFYPLTCEIDGESTYLAELTYYKYDESDFVFSAPVAGVVTLTIG